MKMKITDNFLDPSSFSEIKKGICNQYFPWTWGDGVVYDPREENNIDPLYDFQFVHVFYHQRKDDLLNIRVSDELPILKPIFDQVKPKRIFRIKANLNVVTPNIIQHGFHRDYDDAECKTSILYLNTNNGYTEFRDGTKIESVENRLVTFDVGMEHTGSSCTDNQRRITLNFNWVL